MYDAISVGAGPAGLSAALWLGRCRRHVLICDSGRPHNGPVRCGAAMYNAKLKPLISKRTKECSHSLYAPIICRQVGARERGRVIRVRDVSTKDSAL
jgi:flavin-dependent dehydrogenase